VNPTPMLEQRERLDGLLRRLLRPDVDRYYSAILQCVRYIVSTDFLTMERPGIALAEAPAVAELSPMLALPVEPPCDDDQVASNEDELDDTDIAELADVLV